MPETVEPAHKRIERIRQEAQTSSEYEGVLPVDVLFLLQRLDDAERGLRAQQNSVDDTARRWREIGYQDGYSAGYDDAMQATV